MSWLSSFIDHNKNTLATVSKAAPALSVIPGIGVALAAGIGGAAAAASAHGFQKQAANDAADAQKRANAQAAAAAASPAATDAAAVGGVPLRQFLIGAGIVGTALVVIVVVLKR